MTFAFSLRVKGTSCRGVKFVLNREGNNFSTSFNEVVDLVEEFAVLTS